MQMPDQLDPAKWETFINIGQGVRYRWLADGKILNTHLPDISREVVDVWVDGVLAVALAWAVEKPFLQLHEIEVLPLTAYLRQRTAEAIEKFDHLHGHSAIILTPSIFSTVIKLYVNWDAKRINPNIVRRVFTNFDEGYAWLAERT